MLRQVLYILGFVILLAILLVCALMFLTQTALPTSENLTTSHTLLPADSEQSNNLDVGFVSAPSDQLIDVLSHKSRKQEMQRLYSELAKIGDQHTLPMQIKILEILHYEYSIAQDVHELMGEINE